MFQSIKDFFFLNNTQANLFYDDASSVSDWSTTTTTTTYPPAYGALQAQQKQSQYYQQLKAWQNMQSSMTSTWGYIDSAKEIDRQLIEKVRHRAEHYAAILLREVGCA